MPDKSNSIKKTLLIIVGVLIILGASSGVYLLKASENPAFCSSCHVIAPYYESWNDSQLLAHQHAVAEVECLDCHESTIPGKIEEGARFVTGSYTIPLEKLEFSREACLECHEDFAAIQAKTNFYESNPHDSHNGEQECNLCHNMHQKSKVMCSECHVFNWIKDLNENAWEKK